MPKFSLTPYEIRIKEIQSRKYLPFDDIKGKNFTSFLEDALSTAKNTKILNTSSKTLSLDQIVVENTELRGIIHSGEYGIEADFVDTKTMKTHPKMRKQKHSEVYPFFFLFNVPNNRDYGYVILQEFRGRGIKSVFYPILEEFAQSENLSISMKPIFSPKLLEMIEQSRLVSLRFIKREVPKDIADLVHEEKSEEISEERVIRARPGERIKITSKLKKILKKALSDTRDEYYTILDEKYDMVKAKIKKSGSIKTLTFGPEHKLRERLILEKPTVKGGFPTFDYLTTQARKYLADIKSQALRG